MRAWEPRCSRLGSSHQHGTNGLKRDFAFLQAAREKKAEEMGQGDGNG